MKSVLLTWYGITDLRASLGFEKEGPVFGALADEEYDQVIVLGYSDDAKQSEVGTFDDNVFVEGLKSVDKTDYRQMSEFVGKYSNTCQAHKWYCEWLESRIASLGRTTELLFSPVHLKELNDTEGIYDAALTALGEIAASPEECLITLFLSPGTPVMAFVWAFAALNFPRVKKRLISSSRPGSPPEDILLPQEWMEWNGRRVIAPMAERRTFDLIFHLFGEQRMPSYWGVSQYAAKYHVFVTSEEYRPEVLAPFLNGAKPYVLRVDPFNPEDVRVKILDALEKMKAPASARIGFNLTGGTKLMYAGAMSACRKINGTPFYFIQQSNCVVDLLTFERIPIKTIKSVETFLALNSSDLRLSFSGKWEDIPDIFAKGREELTNFLWQHKGDVADIYKEISAMIDPRRFSGYDAKKKAREGCAPFTYPAPGQCGAHQIIASSEWDETAEFRMGATVYNFTHFPYFAKYITGGWFEEYVYSQFKLLQDKGLIFDLRIGLTLSFNARLSNKTHRRHRPQSGNEERSMQEFDALFTDGSRLYIVECKAGNVTSDHVVKLNDSVQRYGGIGGRGILVCCFPPRDPTVVKRIKERPACRVVYGDAIVARVEGMIRDDRKAYV